MVKGFIVDPKGVYKPLGNSHGIQVCGLALYATSREVRMRRACHLDIICACIFCGFNFRGYSINCKNHNNWTPQFPTIVVDNDCFMKSKCLIRA